MLDILFFWQNKCRLDYYQGKAARSSFGHFKQVMRHCVGFACELLPLKALRYLLISTSADPIEHRLKYKSLSMVVYDLMQRKGRQLSLIHI